MLCCVLPSMEQRCGIKIRDDTLHEQAKASAMERDEKHVNAIVLHITENMTNPFDVDAHPQNVLLNIATGVHASADVQHSLLSVSDEGKMQYESFVEGTLSTKGSRSFYSPITKSGLKTFSDMHKRVKLLHNGQKISANCNPEARGDVSMDFIMSQPITSVPTLIFHEDGTMRKTNKAELLGKLEDGVESLQRLPQDHDISNAVYIRDAMAAIQAMKGDSFRSFDVLALQYMRNLLSCFSQANTVVEVFDRYDNEQSVKTTERMRLQGNGARQ